MTNRGCLLLLAGILCLCACRNKEKEQIAQLVSEWQNKEIVFPEKSTFTYFGEDTTSYPLPKSTYKILVYVDSAGCMKCTLKLPLWKQLIKTVNSSAPEQIPFLFYFHPHNYEQIKYILKRDDFDLPVCIDPKDELNKLNHFPSEMMFQTFLLDSSNRVLAIGNPILTPQIQDLYLKIITGNNSPGIHTPETSISLARSEINMGQVSAKDTSAAIFHLSNTGETPLLIKDIVTSCGCTSAEYEKRPVKKGEDLQVKVKIKPDAPGFFEKTLSVYCNTPDTPVKLTIKGYAQ